MGKHPSFHHKTLPETVGDALEENQYQGVHFTLTDHAEEIMETIKQWFADEDAVILIDWGTTVRGFSFIILEWEGCEISPSFLEVLGYDQDVDDYSIYLRDETYEEV
jgi:hypothetical protein